MNILIFEGNNNKYIRTKFIPCNKKCETIKINYNRASVVANYTYLTVYREQKIQNWSVTKISEDQLQRSVFDNDNGNNTIKPKFQ